MTIQDYTKKELSLIDNISEDKKREIMNLINQTEQSASQLDITEMLKRLLDFKPLSPLTGEDDEWEKVDDYIEDDKATYQNKRYFSVFKRGKNGKAYNFRARIFSTDGGKSWHFMGSESKEYISFPYEVPNAPRKVLVKYVDAETGEILNVNG